MACIINTPTLETPQCVGKNIQEALQILSNCDLDAKLLEEQEDNDIPAGTILAQRPTYKQKIKPQQTVFLVISKKSKETIAPDLTGKSLINVTEELKNNNILHKNYSVPSQYPHNTCIAQLPRAGQPLHEKRIITYCAASTPQLFIFPDLTQHTAPESIAFLQEHGITPHLSHSKKAEDHVCKNCQIIDQKPLAGSVMYLDKPLDVHLHISHV